MSEYTEFFERAAARYESPSLSTEGLMRRRARKRRNRRLADGAVGLALFVAVVWTVRDLASLDRSQTPIVPAETGPAQTGTLVAPEGGWDGMGIPPEGTVLSTPAAGELIAQANTVSRVGSVSAYADGRVVWLTNGSPYPVQRRLTPEGVELVRTGEIRAEDLFPPQIAHGVPASAWADPEPKPYAPTRYAVCPAGVIDLLPASAQALLRGKERSFQGDGLIDNPDEYVECYEVTTEDARALNDIFAEADFTPEEIGPVAPAAWSLRNDQGDRVLIEFMTLFPDGRWHTAGGG